MIDRFVFLVASVLYYLAGYSSAPQMDPAVPTRKALTLPTLHSLRFQQAAISLCLCDSPCVYLISHTSLFVNCNKYISKHWGRDSSVGIATELSRCVDKIIVNVYFIKKLTGLTNETTHINFSFLRVR
jgi:hypothetical protein